MPVAGVTFVDSRLVFNVAKYVTSFLGLFGSILLKIAPPLPASVCTAGLNTETTNASIASVAATALGLLIIAATRGKATKASAGRWFRAALMFFIVAVVLLPSYLAVHSFLTASILADEPAQAGNVMTIGLWSEPRAYQTAFTRGLSSPTSMIGFFGCDEVVPRLWPMSSVVQAYALMMGLYLIALLCVVASFFSVSEGVFRSFQKAKPGDYNVN